MNICTLFITYHCMLLLLLLLLFFVVVVVVIVVVVRFYLYFISKQITMPNLHVRVRIFDIASQLHLVL